MNVSEAIAARKSIRAFLPTPIEPEVLQALFATASRSPSWANSQPWEVYVASGETLQRIKTAYAANYAQGVAASPETPRPTAWSQAAVQRREQLHPGMQRDCGDDAKQFGVLNQTMFNAPTVAFMCMDKVLSAWSLYDIGAYAQSLMLAAVEQGIGTIPAIQVTNFPEVLHRELGIPDNLQVTIGIAMGYADPNHGINRFLSDRSPVEETVHFHG